MELNGSFGVPKNWRMPAPLHNWVTGKQDIFGMEWIGHEPATEDDINALKAGLGENVHIDEATLVGKDDPAYESFDTRVRKSPYKKKTVVLGR